MKKVSATKRPRNRELVKRVRKLRRDKGFTQESFAEALLVKQSAVSSWEQGTPEPSAENYVRLANMAAESNLYDDAIWFLSRAGVQRRTLQTLSDRYQQHYSAAQAEIAQIVDGLPELAQRYSLTSIPSLGPSTEKMLFPGSFLSNPASTRFFRVQSPESRLYRQGDILLIDTLTTDLRKLQEGSFVAISKGKTSDPCFGFVSKQPTGKNVAHFIFRQLEGGESIVLGTSTDSKAPELARENIVLGRVIAWLMPEQEPEGKKART